MENQSTVMFDEIMNKKTTKSRFFFFVVYVIWFSSDWILLRIEFRNRFLA